MVHLLDTSLADLAVVCAVRPSMSTFFAKVRLTWLALVRARRPRDEAGVCPHSLVETVQEQAVWGRTYTHEPEWARIILNETVCKVAPNVSAGSTWDNQLVSIPVERVMEARGEHCERSILLPRRHEHDTPVHCEGPDAQQHNKADQASPYRVVTESPEACNDQLLEAASAALRSRLGHSRFTALEAWEHELRNRI